MADRIELIIDTDTHVADVMLNRADKLNAVDLEMFEALGAAEDEKARAGGVGADGDLEVIAGSEQDIEAGGLGGLRDPR